MSCVLNSSAYAGGREGADRTLARELRLLAQQVDRCGSGELLRAAAQRMEAPCVQIGFLGRFSVGKSSVLNCALGRALLPASDLPETGVTCTLVAGDADALLVHERGGSQETLRCSTANISRFVSLWTEAGPRNESLEQVEAIEIRLQHFPGGDARWIDTPGMDEDFETERGARIHGDSDLVLWVLSSRSLFSEIECEAVVRRIANCGSQSIVLVVNVFLNPGVDAAAQWRQVLEEKRPQYLRRIADRCRAAGVAPTALPRVLLVSAAQELSQPGRFGGAELGALLAEHSDGDASAVRRLRIARLALELEAAVASVEAGLQQLKSDNQRRREALDAAADQQRRDRARIRREVDDALCRHAREFGDAAQSVGSALAAAMSGPERSGAYERSLNEQLAAHAKHKLDELQRYIESLDLCTLRWDKVALRTLLADLLRPDPVSVAVPQSPLRLRGAGKGVLAGAALGLVLGGPVGAVVVGIIFGRMSARDAANARDLEVARHNAKQAAAGAAQRMQQKSGEVLAPICQTLSAEILALPAPEDAAQATLETAAARLNELLEAARTAGVVA